MIPKLLCQSARSGLERETFLDEMDGFIGSALLVRQHTA